MQSNYVRRSSYPPPVSRRGKRVVSAAARVTDGVVFYQYDLETPLDPALPRTGALDKR